jgi:DNA-binding transcriptional LysR family regulator
MNVHGKPGSPGPANAVPAMPPAALAGMRLRHLSCFVAVAQEPTLARAAARLHLSQPAVSKTLSELERMAGAHLVQRGRAGTSLTAAGEQFLGYAADVTRAMDAAATALGGGIQAATVRVGALHTVAGGLLARAIARLHARRPDVACTVRMAHNPELLDALTAGELDFAVGRMAEPPMMRGVSFELLYAESVAVVARPGHPLAAAPGAAAPDGAGPGGLVSPRALLRYPLLIPEAGTAPRLQAEAIFAAGGAGLPARRVETQSSSLARSLTLLSDAVWITPAHAVALDVGRGWLSQLNVSVPAAAEPVGLLSRISAPSGEPAGALMGILRDLA